jgi:hypothetical protein
MCCNVLSRFRFSGGRIEISGGGAHPAHPVDKLLMCCINNILFEIRNKKAYKNMKRTLTTEKARLKIKIKKFL